MSCTLAEQWGLFGDPDECAGKDKGDDASGSCSITKGKIAAPWTREMPTKSLSPQQPFNTFQSSIDGHTRRNDPTVQRCRATKHVGKIRQWNFGKSATTGVGEFMQDSILPPPKTGYGDFMQDSILPPPKAVGKVEPSPSDSPTLHMRDMRSGELKQSWLMTIPNSTFGEGEDWGLLRDAQVRFEPDRIIVEAHDRLGHSRIIHCSNIPRRLDTESSTYQVDPNGLSVFITLKIYKSLPGENAHEEALAEKDDSIQKMKDENFAGEKVKGWLGCQVERPKGCGVSPSTAKDFL